MLQQNNINGSSQLYSSYPLQMQATHLQPTYLRQDGWNSLSQHSFPESIGTSRPSGYSFGLNQTQPLWSTRQAEGYNVPVSVYPYATSMFSQQINPSFLGSIQSYGLPQQQINPALVGTLQAQGLQQQQITTSLVATLQSFGLPQQQISQVLATLQTVALPQQQISQVIAILQACGLPQQQISQVLPQVQACSLTQQQINQTLAYASQQQSSSALFGSYGLNQQINPSMIGSMLPTLLSQQHVNPTLAATLQTLALQQQQLFNPSFASAFTGQGYGSQFGGQFGSQFGGQFNNHGISSPLAQTYAQQAAYGINPMLAGQLATSPFQQQSLISSITGFPRISVIERHDAFVVTAEVPGVTDKEIEVYVHHNEVTIRGNRMADTSEQQNPLQVAERHFGPFVRTLSLPIAVIASKVKAELRDGLLVVELPKITQSEGDFQRVKLNSK